MQDDLVALVEKLPAFSKSVNRVLSLSNQIDASPHELVEVLEHDPVMTARMLKLVNSPFFGLAQTITSVHHALVYVGLNTLKNTALSLALVGALPRRNKADFDVDSFWLHSVAVGTLSRVLGRRHGIPRLEAEDFFVAGLLHDLGKLVLAVYKPETFKRILATVAKTGVRMCEAERDALGVTHSELGALVARKWQLPGVFEQAIKYHHTPELQPPSVMVECVFLGNQLAKKLNYGHAGDPHIEPVPPGLQQRWFVDLDVAIEELPDIEEELASARIFVE